MQSQTSQTTRPVFKKILRANHYPYRITSNGIQVPCGSWLHQPGTFGTFTIGNNQKSRCNGYTVEPWSYDDAAARLANGPKPPSDFFTRN